MKDLIEMNTREVEDYLDTIENGTYTCNLILKKEDNGFSIEVDTDEPHEIVKVIVSFGWNTVMEDDFDVSDTTH